MVYGFANQIVIPGLFKNFDWQIQISDPSWGVESRYCIECRDINQQRHKSFQSFGFEPISMVITIDYDGWFEILSTLVCVIFSLCGLGAALGLF